MVAILTGDIIQSRKVVDAGVWLGPLKQLLNRFGQSPTTWEIFRGDSFQLEVNPEEALYAALSIKATIIAVKGMDVRIAIGLGEKNYSAEGVSESNGEAFVFSGETLEVLKQEKNSLRLRSRWPELDEELNLIINLVLVITNNWSVTSAETARLVLQQPDLSQQELAKEIGIRQSSVSARYNRAHLKEILQVIAYSEKRIHQQISEK